jgi:hypothetical protein
MLGEKEKEKTLKGTQEKKDLQHYPIYWKIQNAVSMWLLSLKASDDPIRTDTTETRGLCPFHLH